MPRNPKQKTEQQKRQPEGYDFSANNVHNVKAPNHVITDWAEIRQSFLT
jgi:hypothetical protein